MISDSDLKDGCSIIGLYDDMRSGDDFKIKGDRGKVGQVDPCPDLIQSSYIRPNSFY